MRVGIYAPDLHDGARTAPQKCLLNLTNALEKLGVDMTFVKHSRGAGDSVYDGRQLTISRIPGIASRHLNRAQFDVVHFNTLVNQRPPAFLNAATVAVCHGDLHWELPKQYGPFSKAVAARVVEAVNVPLFDRVVCVSADLEGRMSNRYAALGIQSETVHNGIDHTKFRPTRNEDVLESYGIDRPYLLHVSNFAVKKNSHGILAAHRRIIEEMDVPLVICGGDWENNDAAVEALADHPGNFILTGFVPEEHLPVLYTQAEVFLYPSFHETFGLPIVEAMACGTPVVTSDAYAMSEMAGDAAELCNPSEPASIASCVLRLLSNDKLRQRRRKQGLERAADFSWDRTARQMRQVYSEII